MEDRAYFVNGDNILNYVRYSWKFISRRPPICWWFPKPLTFWHKKEGIMFMADNSIHSHKKPLVQGSDCLSQTPTHISKKEESSHQGLECSNKVTYE